MSSVDDLERSLQRRWDLDALSVYADALIAAGDPRGELIALDIALANGSATLGIAERRADKVRAWLDDVLGEQLPLPAQVRFGLVEDFAVSGSAGSGLLHDAGVGRYLRSVNISAAAIDLPTVLGRLAREPLPWLKRLSIFQQGVGPLARIITDVLAARTPNLTELILDGDQVMVTPGHPNVTTLRISGRTSIVIGPEPMPAVEEIDLAFDWSGRRTQRAGGGERARLAGLVNPRAFPRLSRLDLSRNEFVYPTDLDCNVGVFPFVDAIEDQERIVHFRLPSLRNTEDVAGVRKLLEDPNRTVEVARMYGGSDHFMKGLEHPRFSLPAPRPWPPRDRVAGREALTIDIPNRPYDDHVALSSWIETLEHVFDDLDFATRRAWVELWEFLADLDWETADGEEVVRPFPAATLLAALETTDDHRSHAVKEKLQTLAPGELANTDVTIKRYWGW